MNKLGLILVLLATSSVKASPVCEVKAYGAKGNGKDLDTQAIQKAVNECQGKDGTVHFTSGTYLSGTITLGSHMTVQLDEGATLLGVQAGDEAYPDLHPTTTNGQLLNCRKALLYSDGAVDLTIEGPGTIDGNGAWPAWNGNVKEFRRPMAVFMVQSQNLKISSLNVKNSAMWSVVLLETTDTSVDHLSVDSPSGPTRDGIDIVDGNRIHLDHLTIHSEDDSICLKSGIASGLHNVDVTNSHILGSIVANGLKFGTASTGLVDSIHFQNILVENVAQAAMAIESVDGSNIKDVTFDTIQFNNVGAAFYVILGWRGDPKSPKPGSISNLTFKNISGSVTQQTWGSAISGSIVAGTTYAPKNIQFENVNVTLRGWSGFSTGHLPPTPAEYTGQYPDPRLWGDLPASGLYFRHVEGVSLEEVEFKSNTPDDKRPLILNGT